MNIRAFVAILSRNPQYNFPKMRGRGQRLFGTFPKIHPIWKCGADRDFHPSHGIPPLSRLPVNFQDFCRYEQKISCWQCRRADWVFLPLFFSLDCPDSELTILANKTALSKTLWIAMLPLPPALKRVNWSNNDF